MIRFVTLFALVLLHFTALAQAKKSRQPNIILIVSDDHSAPFLGCYGYPEIKTPNIDKLAAEGIIFKKAYTTAPQCVLSRAAIMTGRNTLDIQMTRFSAPLDASVTSYPELLRKGGYHTGILGRSFHLDGNRRVPETVAVLEKYNLETFKNRVDYLKASGNRDTIFQQYTEFLDQAPKGKPFFVQVGYSDPHRLFNAKNFEPDPAKISVPAHWPDTKLLREDFAAYLGEIQRLDSDVGRVLEDLKKRGLDQNTLVVFIGDNGGALLRGKGTLYDLGIHVPLIIRYPGLIKAGQTSDALVSGIDIAPTFLSVAGLPVPKEITGQNLAPAFSNPQFAGHDHIFAVRGAHGQGLPTNSSNFDLGRTIFNKKYKLIYNAIWQIPYHPVDFAGQPFWLDLKQKHAEGTLAEPFDKLLFADRRQMFELYDEEKDPFETNNLAGKPEAKQIEHELKSRLQEWMIVNRDYLPLPIAP
ncbi:sulfatase [Dyadobacter chenwenxiniae]|uniref:Sulfatase n=1 Tax=Dyadobacter chenwenxiniae TaxID=2906456 RepID=A0A9X1TFP0_9BACT|nr:sulfatase [Dyadobacter chenwenxiniae]MCF0062829.1 sulfatase [Dyadobacter chenwenxiniae]UON84996.1 sulfatase [Dyadobacter chenwenxiniae]